MLGENQPPNGAPEGEFEGSQEAVEAGVDLESARRAYQFALEKLQKAFPDHRQDKKFQTVELKKQNAAADLLLWPLRFMLGVIGVFRSIFRELREIIQELGEDVRLVAGGEQARRAALKRSTEAAHLQQLLLEVLWARDYVQYVLEQPEPVPYHVKRDTLHYLIENDNLLDDLRRKVVEKAELDPIKLRKAQPTPPKVDAWWWFLDNRRARRARRMNAFWFALATVPALAAIILVTLLTQRLAIDGPDVLSGASALAQIVLGLVSILAGREILNAFFFDRSTGRSWQGEATFALATLFFVVVTTFYLVAPPAAAQVYNWFGQRAIDAGNAAEAELYLESATRLDPDPHAADLLEVGCLYLTLGAPDRAENVFERVLEADSRLLLARYYLAEIYSDQGEYEKALQLIADGLNLLDSASVRADENDGFLWRVNDPVVADQVEYLLRLSFGRAYLETNTFQQAKANLAKADQIFQSLRRQEAIPTTRISGSVALPCAVDRRLGVYIVSTELDLRYLQARTFDAICATDEDDEAARSAWNIVARSRPSNSRQEARIAEASERLEGDKSCTQLKVEVESATPQGSAPSTG